MRPEKKPVGSKASFGATVTSKVISQKEAFENGHKEMKPVNHKEYENDPYYYPILFHDISINPEYWEEKSALEIGCGCGRNLKNLLELAPFAKVDGCDLSKSNAAYAKEYADSGKCSTWENNDTTLSGPDHHVENEEYDFVFSVLVFQHIPQHFVRKALLRDAHRVLKKGGRISIHFMDLARDRGYYDNSPEGDLNSRVDNPDFLTKDFEGIGFKEVSVQVKKDHINGLTIYYVRGIK